MKVNVLWKDSLSLGTWLNVTKKIDSYLDSGVMYFGDAGRNVFCQITEQERFPLIRLSINYQGLLKMF